MSDEPTPIRKMINHAQNKEYSKIMPIFKELVTARIVDKHEARKAEIGANLFNTTVDAD